MNTKGKEDRRVRKTKKALREGLAELLIEKDIQNITVRELTDKVDIHRSTFYANFTDIYDLYAHMEDIVLKEISDIASEDCISKPVDFFEIILKYIADNKQVCRLFFEKSVNTTFFNHLIDIIKDNCLNVLHKEHNITITNEEIDYYVQFHLSGSLGVIGKWITGDFEYSTEKLVKMLAEIDCNFTKFVITQIKEN